MSQIRLHDPRTGWELRRTAAELRREGLRVTLGPYEARVLAIEVVASPAATVTVEAEPCYAAPAAGATPAKVAATTRRTRPAPSKPAPPPKRRPTSRPVRRKRPDKEPPTAR